MLSTEVPTQLDYEMPLVCKTESIFVKMDSAEAACTPIVIKCINLTACYMYIPVVTHMSNKWVFIKPQFSSNNETVRGFIFLSPVSLLPSIAIENGLHLMLSTSIHLKCGANDPLIIHADLVRAQA